MITIADRIRLPEFFKAFEVSGATFELVTLGHGTVGRSTLDHLGLSMSEKAVIFSTVTSELWLKLKHEFERRIRIDVPGTGISFTVPLSSVGGGRELALLSAGADIRKEGESELKGTDRELIITVCNQGYSEIVMDAARKAGAGGGTIIHAKGTGVESSEKFLGFTLASEKDIILIVTRTDKRSGIMQSVMQNAGLETDAKAISFSMPVTDAAGLRLIEEEEE